MKICSLFNNAKNPGTSRTYACFFRFDGNLLQIEWERKVNEGQNGGNISKINRWRKEFSVQNDDFFHKYSKMNKLYKSEAQKHESKLYRVQTRNEFVVIKCNRTIFDIINGKIINLKILTK